MTDVTTAGVGVSVCWTHVHSVLKDLVVGSVIATGIAIGTSNVSLTSPRAG